MRRLLLLLALLPLVALAQPLPPSSGLKANCPTCNLTDKTLTLTGTSGNVLKIKQGTAIDFNSGTDTATLSYDGSNYNFANVGTVVSPGGFDSNNGFGNGAGTGGASQGLSFSGSTTTIVCGDNNVCISTIQDNSGHIYATFSSTGIDLTSAGTGIAKTNGLTCSGATHCGTQALSTGTATVTVVSGCHAICTDTTANASVKCSVSSTTLTITGTGSDSINYFCF